MLTLHEQRHLPYSPQQLFDLVSDVESYPRFLPHVAAARICRRDGDRLTVDQVFRLKALRFRFTTQAHLQPPGRLSVRSDDSPFGKFRQDWQFEPDPAGGSILICDAQFEIRSSLLRRTLDGVFGELIVATLRAFSERADKLYGATAAVD